MDNHIHDKNKSERVRENWKKVNNIFIGKKNKIIGSGKLVKGENGIKLFDKEDSKLTEEQHIQFCSEKCETEITTSLAEISDIVRTTYTICFDLKLNLFKPIPNMSYLSKQPVGNGNVDTTGAWVWIGEEVLAYFITKKLIVKRNKIFLDNPNEDHQEEDKKIKGKNILKILELGAGCSGLSSIVFAHSWSNELLKHQNDNESVEVYITDGQKDNIIFLHKNIEENRPHFNKERVQMKALQYCWGDNFEEIEGKIEKIKFQFIMAADCLFFEEYHDKLVITLSDYLHEDGVALFVSPKRGFSFDNFIKKLMNYGSDDISKRCEFGYKLLKFEDSYYEGWRKERIEKQNFNGDTDEFEFLEVFKKNMKGEDL